MQEAYVTIGEHRDWLKEYGNIIIEYWLKYFGDKANRKAQYFKKQDKSLRFKQEGQSEGWLPNR